MASKTKKNNNNKTAQQDEQISLSESFKIAWLKFLNNFLEPELLKMELPPEWYAHFNHIKTLDIAFVMTEMARSLPKYSEQLQNKDTIFFINLIKVTTQLDIPETKIEPKVIDKAYEYFEVFKTILIMIGQAAQQQVASK